MATAKKPETSSERIADSFSSLPAGFELRTSDIVGTWHVDSGPVQFIPSHAVVGDGKRFDATKPSLLIFGKLTAPCKVVTKGDDDADDEKSVIDAKKGDLIGVWAKPGMKEIANLCGTEVFLCRFPGGDIDTGKGEKMKAYRVASKEAPNKLIPITADRRDKAVGNRTFLDPPNYGKAGIAF